MMNVPSTCRICLVQDEVQLRLIVDTHLQEMYESLTFMPFVTEDGRPVVVCDICCAKLEDCYQLRRSCIQSENLFTQMLKCIVQVRLEKISLDVHLSGNDVVERTPPGCYINEVKQEDTEVAEQDLMEDDCIQLSDPEERSCVLVKKEESEHTYVAEQDPLEDDYIQPSDPEEDSRVLVGKQTQSEATYCPPVVKKPASVQQKLYEDITTNRLQRNEKHKAETHQSNIETNSTVDKPEQENKDIEACYIVKIPINTQQSNKPITPKSRNKIDGHQNIANDSSNKYLCDTCQKYFRTNSELICHNRTHTGEKSYICDICKKCLSQRANLVVHLRIHTGEKPYSCDICKKCFSRKGNLDKHIIRIHKDDIGPPYSCDICKKCFTLKRAFDTHTRKNPDEKPYSCDICKKCFGCRKFDLIRHIRTHTGEKPYRCDICKKCFSQKGDLNIHIRRHTGEKPYSCDICKKCFSGKCNLYTHIRRHTGQKPYSCDNCKKCFTAKGHLYTHMRTHTGKKP